MLFLKDTDGDGKADERKVLFTGFGTRDTHAGPSQPAVRARQLDLRDHRLLRLQRRGRRRAAQLPPGVLPVQARRLEAGVPPQHEQQLVGRRHQRGGPALRLDRQRLPERLHADPEPLLRVGPRHVARRCWRTSPTRTASSRSPRTSARSTGTAGSPPGPARRSTRRGPTRSSTGTGPPSSPSRPGTSSRRSRCIPDGTDFHSHNAWNLVASDDEWTSPILAEVGPDGQRLGDRLVQLHRPAQPDARGVQDRQGGRLRDAPARQDARADLSDRRARTASRASGRSCRRTTRRGSSRRCKNDNMFWRLHAQRLLVERGEDDRRGRLAELIADRSVDATGLNAAGDPCHLGAARAGRAAGHRSRRGGRWGVRGGHEGDCSHPSAAVRRSAVLALPRRSVGHVGRAAERRPRRPGPAGPPGRLPGDGRDARPHAGATAPRGSSRP